MKFELAEGTIYLLQIEHLTSKKCELFYTLLLIHLKSYLHPISLYRLNTTYSKQTCSVSSVWKEECPGIFGGQKGSPG